MNPTAKTLALSITFAAALAACGGGGGTTPTTTPPAPTTPAPIATNPIVTSVPATTYAAGSDERIAYDYLNAERQKCGFGLLAQDTRLDASAAAHVSYLLKNNVIAHTETPGLPGFSGVSPFDRAKSKGYSGASVGEDGASAVGGLANITVLLSAPYHTLSLIAPYTDVGLSYQSISVTQQISTLLFLNPGYKGTTVQLPNAGTVLTYPCEGVAGMKPLFRRESINWAAIAGEGSGGAPVVVTAPNGETLVITSASVTPVGGGVVPVVVLTADTDPQKFLRKSDAFVIPPSTLTANTTYRVQITGTVAGVPFSKDFLFKTGT